MIPTCSQAWRCAAFTWEMDLTVPPKQGVVRLNLGRAWAGRPAEGRGSFLKGAPALGSSVRSSAAPPPGGGAHPRSHLLSSSVLREPLARPSGPQPMSSRETVGRCPLPFVTTVRSKQERDPYLPWSHRKNGAFRGKVLSLTLCLRDTVKRT